MVPLLSRCERHDVPWPSPLASFFPPLFSTHFVLAECFWGLERPFGNPVIQLWTTHSIPKLIIAFCCCLLPQVIVSLAGASSLSAASWCNFPQGHCIR